MKKLRLTLFPVFASLFAAVTGALSLTACQEKMSEEYAYERADSFALFYYNWQYEKCLPFVTPESVRFLQLAASNVTADDVDLLRSADHNAVTSVDNIDMQSDTLCLAHVVVSDVYAHDTICRPAHLYDKGEAELRMVKRYGKWYVDITGGPVRTAYQQQSEQPGHDSDSD